MQPLQPLRQYTVRSVHYRVSALLTQAVTGEVDELGAASLGLDPAVVPWLCAVRAPRCGMPPQGKHPADTAALVLHLHEGAGGLPLPQRLHIGRSGAWLPVRAERGSVGVQLQGAVQCRNATHPQRLGSLGTALRLDAEPERVLLLASGHVAAASAHTRRGDTLQFSPAGGTPFDATLLDWQPNFTLAAQSVRLDAALAELDAERTAALLAQADERPLGASAAFAHSRLRLRTRGGEITGGDAQPATATVEVGGGTRYTLHDALAWRPAQATQGGDSGAPLWDEHDRLVGIHAAGGLIGGEPYALAVPIARVLEWARCSVVLRGEPLHVARSQPRAAAADRTPLVNPVMPLRNEADVLARTLYGEARGEGEVGMRAVGHVVLNRVAARRWWGSDVKSVCLQPWQFSCWNVNDPNLRHLRHAGDAEASFRLAFDIASRLLASEQADAAGRARADDTQGATHYYANSLRAPPVWARGRAPCARIGKHLFFKGIA